MHTAYYPNICQFYTYPLSCAVSTVNLCVELKEKCHCVNKNIKWKHETSECIVTSIYMVGVQHLYFGVQIPFT